MLGARTMGSGDALSFHIVLIGPALTHQSIVMHALSAALGTVCGKPDVLRCTGYQVIDAPTDSVQDIAGNVTITFSTPFRVQRNGNPIRSGEQLTARNVMMSTVKRVAQVCETLLGTSTDDIPFRALADAASTVEMAHTLVWHDLARYSERQHHHIPVGGLIGSVHLRGELAPFAPYLHLCQWLHIGKESAFGLGQYRLLPPSTR